MTLDEQAIEDYRDKLFRKAMEERDLVRLRDEVAMRHYLELLMDYGAPLLKEGCAEMAFDHADIFMTERLKR